MLAHLKQRDILVLQTKMELSAAQQHVQQLTHDLELKSTQMEQLLEHANSLDEEHIAHIQEAEEDLAALDEVRPACLQPLHAPSSAQRLHWQPRMRGAKKFMESKTASAAIHESGWGLQQARKSNTQPSCG